MSYSIQPWRWNNQCCHSVRQVFSGVGTINVSAASLTKQIETAQLKIFPNPVKNMVQWEYAGKDLKRVTLISTDGKVLKNWSISNKTSTIPTDDLPSGTYILAGYSDEKELWVRKFEKQ